MSFIAYLCWLLGIAAPTDCDATGYDSVLIDACAATDEGQVDTSNGQTEQHTPRHSSQRTNIDVSI